VGEYVVLLTAYLLSGWGVITRAGKNILKGRIFDENFLMTVASLSAIALHKIPEAVAVMLFYQIGETFQDYAVGKSRNSIKSLLEIRPDQATLKTNTGIEIVSPENVNIGDIIIIKAGEKIPLDGKIINGSSQIDTSALTGESIPQIVKEGDFILAGSINQSGTLTAKATKPFAESSIAKILDLVENAQGKKAETEKFISTFARYYTPVVVFLSLGVAIIPPLIFGSQTQPLWIYRALILLIISCPCGLVISIPSWYISGVWVVRQKTVFW